MKRLLKLSFKQEKKFHILVVDDNSPDGTAEIVERLNFTYILIVFLLKKEWVKTVLGTAYIHGFKWAIAKKI